MREQGKKQEVDLIISPRTFQELLEYQTGLCVSMYLPTHSAGPDIEQDPIRLQNLLREAENRLTSQGLRSPEAKTLLGPGMKLLEDRFFWEHQERSLALFFSSKTFRLFRLPLSVSEFVHVGERFYCKPLLPLFSGDGVVFVLVLHQKTRQVYKCTRYTIHELQLEKVPAGLEEAVSFDGPERQLQFHTGAPNTGERRAAVFHGHGTGIDENNDRIIRYFQQVEAGVSKLLRTQHAPMILAAIDPYHHLYHKVNSYPFLLKEGIRKNPEALSQSQIHEEAWAIVRPLLAQAIDEAKARHQELAGTGRTSARLSEIALAACQGRIDILFVDEAAQQWGIVDLDQQRVELHSKAQPTSEELLDVSVIQTFMQGGTIYPLSREDMPEKSPVAAIFRF